MAPHNSVQIQPSSRTAVLLGRAPSARTSPVGEQAAGSWKLGQTTRITRRSPAKVACF